MVVVPSGPSTSTLHGRGLPVTQRPDGASVSTFGVLAPYQGGSSGGGRERPDDITCSRRICHGAGRSTKALRRHASVQQLGACPDYSAGVFCCLLGRPDGSAPVRNCGRDANGTDLCPGRYLLVSSLLQRPSAMRVARTCLWRGESEALQLWITINATLLRWTRGRVGPTQGHPGAAEAYVQVCRARLTPPQRLDEWANAPPTLLGPELHSPGPSVGSASSICGSTSVRWP